MSAAHADPDHDYRLGTALSMSVYAGLIIAISWTPLADALDGSTRYVAAVLPGLAIGWQLRVTLRYMERLDEFLRALMAKRFIAASCLVFAGLAVWGFLEEYAAAPHLNGFLAYPLFWMAFAGVFPFIRSSR